MSIIRAFYLPVFGVFDRARRIKIGTLVGKQKHIARAFQDSADDQQKRF